MSAILSLHLDQLEQPLKIHSRTLAADLWLLPPDCDGGALEGPVYTCEECRLLAALDLSPAELKAVHLAKALFHGDLLPAQDLRSLRRRYEILLGKYREVERRLDDSSKGTDVTELLQLSSQLSLLLDRSGLVEGAAGPVLTKSDEKVGGNSG